MKWAYYNEHEPFAAQWLRGLIAEGLIAEGEVDERDIRKVEASDLEGFAQCHFFAGIGIWSHALREGGWADGEEVWTASCPCQPFSSAGKGKGFKDRRHLWPEFHRLVRERRPRFVLGEQVANRRGEEWFDAVQADLEAEGYDAGASVFPACSLGAPMLRKRLYWAAHDLRPATGGLGGAAGLGHSGARSQPIHGERQGARTKPCAGGSNSSGMLEGTDGQRGRGLEPKARGCRGQTMEAGDPRLRPGEREVLPDGTEPRGGTGGLGRADDERQAQIGGLRQGQDTGSRGDAGDDGRPGPVHGHWGASDWLLCQDGFWSPVEPGTFPLAHGYPQRVGRLRAYGNALCAPQAALFARVFREHLESEGEAMTAPIRLENQQRT